MKKIFSSCKIDGDMCRPWSIGYTEDAQVIKDSNRTIARFDRDITGDFDANLMSKAPELLDVLFRVKEAMENYAGDNAVLREKSSLHYCVSKAIQDATGGWQWKHDELTSEYKFV
jgi:hypothetical protein